MYTVQFTYIIRGLGWSSPTGPGQLAGVVADAAHRALGAGGDPTGPAGGGATSGELTADVVTGGARGVVVDGLLRDQGGPGAVIRFMRTSFH